MWLLSERLSAVYERYDINIDEMLLKFLVFVEDLPLRVCDLGVARDYVEVGATPHQIRQRMQIT